ALIGVGLPMVGQALSNHWLIYGDAFAGIIVSIIVIKVVYKLSKDSANVVLKQAHSEDAVVKYKQTVDTIEGVIKVHELLASMHGRYIVIDIKLSVDPNITVKEGHDIAHFVKATLIENHNEVEDVFVHINPHFD